MQNNPFDIFGFSEDIKSRSVNGYSSRKFEGDDYRPQDDGQETLKLHVSLAKLNIFFYLIVTGLGLLFLRIVHLQVVLGAENRDLAEGNRIRIEWLKPPRGMISDRNGRAMVENVPNFTLYVVPGDLPKDTAKREALLVEIFRFLERSPAESRKSLNQISSSSYQPIALAENIDIQKAIKLIIETKELPGLSIKAESGRHYLAGKAFSNVLGYCGKITTDQLDELIDNNYQLDDKIGKSGIEKSYEDELRGKYGRKHVEVDSLGKTKNVIASENSVPGLDLTLSLDLTYQEKMQQLIDEKVKSLKSTGGAAVVLDPRNGEILSLVTTPTYDNNSFSAGLSADEYQKLSEDPDKPLFNRPISGEYPSGSTIKPMIAAAALTEGIIKPSTTVYSTGGIKIDQWFFPDWKAGGHGETNVVKAISESVNTFFYAIGGGYERIEGLGVERIKKYAGVFGFGQPLGLDLPGEASGFLPDKAWKEKTKKEPWYMGDTYHLSIGQGDILVTPLQIATLTATVANGGTVYRPTLVRAIEEPGGNSQKYTEPVVIQKNVVPLVSLVPVRKGLREAVVSGSARALQDLPVPAAGKTGTAQYTESKTHSWFTAFAPFDNPEIVVTVIIENGGEGGAAALPVAKEFLTWYYGKR